MKSNKANKQKNAKESWKPVENLCSCQTKRWMFSWLNGIYKVADTDLSVTADSFMKAKKDVQSAKEGLVDAEKKLIGAMYEHKKYTLKHGGYELSIKQGKEPSDKIQMKKV